MSRIEIRNGVTKNPQWAMREPVNFTLPDGAHVAVIGRNGAGKTMFVDMLTGRHPLLPQTVSYDFGPGASPFVSDNIRYIAFRDTYGGDNDRTYFLQQRWNQMEIDAETPTVTQRLEEAYALQPDTPERRQWQRHLYQLFHMDGLLDKPVILLSSGELRKMKLAAALFSTPRVLIMDNPFIGLDAETRQQLRQLLGELAGDGRLQLVLVLSRSDEVPDFITHIVRIDNMVVDTPSLLTTHPSPLTTHPSPLTTHPSPLTTHPSPPTIQFHHVSIRYGDRTILHDLCWTVCRGEHWVLTGPNGSGKSTLLSLVCADNPQGYACDIRLFGRQRGTGETIWDIKRRIGYVSPEMHRSYHRDIAALHIVASGLKDSVGLYAKPTDDERRQCRRWMHTFGIAHLEQRSFLRMSSGEQRLVLLARAFVKEPELLILDEPLHGLDDDNRRLVQHVIEDYFHHPENTLIFVSHYQQEWPKCIDHVLTLNKH
jgi:molybdate transport system ATP-binding protein